MTTRRNLLLASTVMAFASQTASASELFSAEYPKLRLGTDLAGLYQNLLEKGHGVSMHPADSPLPKAVIATDSQCPWCSKLFLELAPLNDKVNFIWFPVAVLNDNSVTQGAYILQSDSPWEALKYQEEHFKDKTKGIDVSNVKVDQKFRDQVWSNSKIVRRAGGTVAPIGVYKNPEGKFIPFFRSFSSLDELK